MEGQTNKVATRTHNNLACNIAKKFKEKQMIKIYTLFQYNLSKYIEKVKVLCVNITVSSKYHYLAFKYCVTENNWCSNLNQLMGKVKIILSVLHVYTYNSYCFKL